MPPDTLKHVARRQCDAENAAFYGRYYMARALAAPSEQVAGWLAQAVEQQRLAEWLYRYARATMNLED